MAEEGQAVKKIFIQQDRAKTHIHEDDKDFKNALMEQSINTKLYMQVANSPHVNSLDLGFSEPSRVSMMLYQKTKRN